MGFQNDDQRKAVMANLKGNKGPHSSSVSNHDSIRGKSNDNTMLKNKPEFIRDGKPSFYNPADDEFNHKARKRDFEIMSDGPKLSKSDLKIKNNLSEKDRAKLQKFISQGHDESLVLRHFITGVEPHNGFKFETYPPIGNEKTGSEINSTSYMKLIKGNRDGDNYVELELKEIDARIRGKPYRIVARVVKNGMADYVNLEASKYDQAVDELNKLMRLF